MRSMAIETVNIAELTPVRRKSAALTPDAKVMAAAEAAFRRSLPSCSDPSGHNEGFMGFCQHCGVDVCFEDSFEFDRACAFEG